ncbi:hypothetical protein DPMN_148661 [Dreissena polymorpha]|uniref:Uncharacterized protein n=1 Tax=Dreissena polymorpha TaxID=45954 RepID=A0A9D4FEH7_DREPO|nr:hypothetical protein DPMN_148661 [Dreissena polymorpha]
MPSLRTCSVSDWDPSLSIRILRNGSRYGGPAWALTLYVMGPELNSRFKYLPLKRTDPDPNPSLSAGPKQCGIYSYMASDQTGARTRTHIPCEVSYHSGTRNQEMLFTELVLISATGR